MDLKPWDCQVCRAPYSHPEKRPRTLPCGHTFCTLCLNRLLAGAGLRCPSCRIAHFLSHTESLPISYDLEAVSQIIGGPVGSQNNEGTTEHFSGSTSKTLVSLTGSGTQPSVPLQVNSETELKQDCTIKSNPVEGPEHLAVKLLANGKAKDSRDITEDFASTIPGATEPTGTASQRNRQPGLSKRLRASLDDQKQELQDKFENCHQAQCQLDWYRTQLANWTKEHLTLLQELSTLEHQNKEVVLQLQEEDARVKEMQEEGRQDMQQLAEMMVTLNDVTTPQDAFVAVNNADCYSEEAEDWTLQARIQFPDQCHVPFSVKIRAATTAALSVVAKVMTGSDPAPMPDQKDPSLSIKEKVQLLTDMRTAQGSAKESEVSQNKKTERTPSSPPSRDTKSPTSPPSRNTRTPASPPAKDTRTPSMPVQDPSSAAAAPSTTSPNPSPRSTVPHCDSSTPPSESSSIPSPNSSGTSVKGKDAESISHDDLRYPDTRVKILVGSGRVYAFTIHDDQYYSSKLSLRNDRIYLHHLQRQIPPDNSIRIQVGEGGADHRGCCLDITSCPIAFLDLFWAGQKRGRVHVQLKTNTVLAKQFALLCTGGRGHTYANTNFHTVGNKGQAGEYIIGGDYESNDGTGGAHMLQGPLGKYRKSDQAGAVFGWYTLGGEKGAQFAILTKDGLRKDGKKYISVFGEVEKSGMQALRLAAQYSNINDVRIADCGVVLNADVSAEVKADA